MVAYTFNIKVNFKTSNQTADSCLLKQLKIKLAYKVGALRRGMLGGIPSVSCLLQFITKLNGPVVGMWGLWQKHEICFCTRSSHTSQIPVGLYG
jgi:hypothetical protein